MGLLFKYHARDLKGIARDSVIEALDEADAVRKLQEQGLIVISVQMSEIEKPEIAEELRPVVKSQDVKWYFKTQRIIIAFLCVGPLALPLVWFNPRFNRKTKVIVTVIVIVLSWFTVVFLIDSLKSLSNIIGI